MKHASLFLALFSLAALTVRAEPPAYVPATAHYLLPETTSEESGYFSLSESLDGAIHVGTAKYNANSFLVEFDPRTGKQRVVLDTHKTCGLTATGYAAQAKLHTRNFVGPSGKVYVGSKQGYAAKGDTQAYPGGYVMTYDPRAGRAENLGMPLAGQGVIDVVADEASGRLYAVTCEEQHWMVGPLTGQAWRELGPLLTPYATTLVDSRGVASAITKDFELAQFDPATERVTTRPILVNGAPWKRESASAIPTWQLAPDGRHAWLLLMSDPTLLRLDLHSAGAHVATESRGRMIEGKNPDSRCALTIHPDGRIYALVRVDNTSGFGTGYLHHLLRYDPTAQRHEDLGVLKVSNPDFFDWSPGADGKPKPWTHGFHKLPDGTLTPLHAHMALLAARDGTLYATILYPFTLLKIDGYKVPAPAASPAARYLDALKDKLTEAEARLPEITALAEKLAERHLAGGAIGFPWIGTTLEQELIGRSGGMMHMGFERAWKKERTAEERAKDATIYAWDDAPKKDDLTRLQADKAKGMFVVGFGAKKSPLLAEHAAACDAWIDSGASEDDRVVEIAGGGRVGKTNHFANAVNGWLLVGEMVSALTRRGKMPPMYRSWSAADGPAWSDRYNGKTQFHEDLTVPPVAAGELGRRYVERIRYSVERLRRTEIADLQAAAERIATELRAGRKTTVASAGHMVMNYVGRFDDALWAVNQEVSTGVDFQLKDYVKTPDGGLVLRLDTSGLGRDVHELFQRKMQRVMLITSENPRPESAIPAGYDLRVDPGIPFGDACVWIDGYPVPILPPSGVMQVAAYESLNVEVHARRTAPRTAANQASSELVIAERGATTATIVVSAEAGRWEKQAAADLAKYIERMSGAKLPIASTPEAIAAALKAGTPLLLVGQEALKAAPTLQTALAGVAKKKPVVRADAVVVKRAGHRVFIAGTNDESHYFAAAWLLQQWGCRWYLPGEFGECIPAQPVVKIGALDHVYAPPFEVRHYWLSWNASNEGAEEFQRRNFMSSSRLAGMGHALGSYTQALIPKGKTMFNVPLAEEATAQEVAARIEPEYAKGVPGISLAIEDGNYVSESARDKELQAGIFDKYALQPSNTDAMMTLYNSVAKRLREKHPQSPTLIGGMAYANVTLPPQRVLSIEPNIVMWLAPIDIDPNHGMDDPRSPPRQEYREMLYRWAELMQGRLVIYDYDQGQLVWRDLPNPSHFAFAQDVKHYRKAGILGVGTESRGAAATTFLNLFFRGQLMWNPDADVAAQLAEFYPKFYGPAAGPMSEYWSAIYAAWERTLSTEHEYFIAPIIYPPEVVAALGASLAKAQKAMEPLRAKADATRNESLFVQRMRFTELSFSVLESYMAMQRAVSEVDFESAVSHGERGLAAREELTKMNPTFTTYKNIGENGASWWPGEVQQYRDLLALTAGGKGTLVLKAPLEWAFRRDPRDTGLPRGWAAKPADLSLWNTTGKRLSIEQRKDYPDAWEVLRTDIYAQGQGVRNADEQSYTGHYWYQTTVDFPAGQSGAGVRLMFPGLFNECWMYLNGELIAHRAYTEPWWRNDYEFQWDVDLAGKLKPGTNLIALRGVNPHHFGGMFRRPFLYRPVGQ